MPYLVTVNLLWAFSFSLIGEYLAGRVDSDFAVLVRVAIAALVFIPFTRWRGLPLRLLGGLWLAGALQFGVTYLCLYRSFSVLTVPEVLLSGHHANIVRWRRKMSLLRTKTDRPDLFARFVPRDKQDKKLLDEIKNSDR